MEKEDIIKKFEQKEYNKDTIDLLLGVIEDFKKTGFTKYVDIETVVDRICKNLDHDISFVDFKDTKYGSYYDKRKTIEISEKLKDKPEYVKSTLFHEVLHCITTFKDQETVGFHQIIKIEEDDDYSFVEGYGMNEGLTAYLQNKRDKEVGFNKEGSSYPILNDLIGNLLLVIGEDEVIDCYFNDPSHLTDVLEKHDINKYELVDAFDDIHYVEKDVVLRKKNTVKNRLMNVLFNDREIDIYNMVKKPMSVINNELFKAIGDISSLEDLDKLVKFVNRIEKQNNGFDSSKFYGYILEQTSRLQEEGKSIEDINRILEENEIKDQIDSQKEIESLLYEDKNETIHKLYEYIKDPEKNNITSTIFDDPSYNNMFLRHLFMIEKRVDFLPYVSNIGKLLKEHPEIDFDEVSTVEYILSYQDIWIAKTEDDKRYGLINGKNIFEFNQEGETQITLDKDENDSSKNQNIKLICDENDVEFIDSETGEELEACFIDEVSSNIDDLRKYTEDRLKESDKRIELMKGPNYPSIIRDNEEKIRKRYIDRLQNEEDRIKERREKALAKEKENVETIDSENKIGSQNIGKAFVSELDEVDEMDKKAIQIKANIEKMQENNKNKN